MRVSITTDKHFGCEKFSEKSAKKNKKCENLLDFYRNLASIVLIPVAIISQWRGFWDLLDHYHQFFPLGPSYILSSGILVILEILRHSHILNHCQLVDIDTRSTIFRKNITLSFYDLFYNLTSIMFWRSVWGHPEGERKIHLFTLFHIYISYQLRRCM